MALETDEHLGHQLMSGLICSWVSSVDVLKLVSSFDPQLSINLSTKSSVEAVLVNAGYWSIVDSV